MNLGSKTPVLGTWIGKVGEVDRNVDDKFHIIGETNEKRVAYKLKAKMTSLAQSNKVTRISDFEYLVE
jgi:hypothetical protein